MYYSTYVHISHYLFVSADESPKSDSMLPLQLPPLPLRSADNTIILDLITTAFHILIFKVDGLENAPDAPYLFHAACRPIIMYVHIILHMCPLCLV